MTASRSSLLVTAAAASVLFAGLASPLATRAQQNASATAARVRLLAANCANCHGTDGRSQGGVPALNGQAKDRIVGALQEFRSGQRPATVMNQLVRGYTDEELDAVAGYFAAQKNGG